MPLNDQDRFTIFSRLDLTSSILNTIPPLYATEHKSEEKTIAHVKLFTPLAGYTFYLTELDFKEGRAFGLVDFMERELGYVDLLELAKAGGRAVIVRDKHFKPQSIASIRKMLDRFQEEDQMRAEDEQA